MEIQFANADPPGERRGEHFLGDDRADPFGGGGGGVARGLGGIEVCLGRVAALNQLTLSFERQIGVLEDREIVLEIGLLHRVAIINRPGPTRPGPIRPLRRFEARYRFLAPP